MLAQRIEGTVEPFYTRTVRVTNCLCPDGKRRTAVITGEPDTFFSMPATVRVRGTKVAGYVTGRETDGERDYEFRVVTYRKNCWVFPEQVLLPGATYEHVDPASGKVYSRGTIAHWHWDRRPYWQGAPRWLVVVSMEHYDRETYGDLAQIVPPEHSWQQMDAADTMRGIYEGRVRVSGGGVIGPEMVDFSGDGGGVWVC